MDFWIIISMTAMLANTGKVLYVKTKCADINSWILVFCARLLAGVVLCILLLFSEYTILNPTKFWITTLATSLLTILASILYLNALKRGYLSLVVPIQAAIPLFMVACTGILYHEIPNKLSFLFIVFIVLSISATLLITANNKKISYSPKIFLSVIESIAAAFLFGICTVLDRIAISSVTKGALVYSAYWNLTTTFLLLPILYFRNTFTINESQKINKEIIPISIYAFLTLIAFFLQQLAVQYSLEIANGVTYVKSIVMTHISLVTLVSILIFKEQTSLALRGASVITFISGIGLILSI